MFRKIEKTAFPPDKPIFIWDGKCGFCKYWIIYWKSKIGDSLEFEPFQEAATRFGDIPYNEFKKASRLIEPDGKVYSGPDSAYRSFMYFKSSNPYWNKLYHRSKWFQKLSDWAYNWIAKHRSFMFRMTKLFFGKNPTSLKPYWMFYLGG